MDIVTDVQVSGPYLLVVTFSDGERREVDIEPLLYGPVFEPLRDPEFFKTVSVDAEIDTIVWPNGADVAPEYLREAGKSIASARVD